AWQSQADQTSARHRLRFYALGENCAFCGGRGCLRYSEDPALFRGRIRHLDLSSPARYDASLDFCEDIMARDNEYKQKYRPADKLDEEVENALGDVSLDKLYGFDKPPESKSSPGQPKGPKRGKIISVDAKKDEVFVDF